MNKYKEEYLPPNYSVHIADITGSEFGKVWNKLGKELNGKQLKAVLYMYGLDTSRSNDIEPLSWDTKMRSNLTGDVISGGFLYTGFERTDKVWVKSGLRNLQKFMYTPEGVDKFIALLEGEVVE